jgi:hypothetical protein
VHPVAYSFIGRWYLTSFEIYDTTNGRMSYNILSNLDSDYKNIFVINVKMPNSPSKPFLSNKKPSQKFKANVMNSTVQGFLKLMSTIHMVKKHSASMMPKLSL